MILAENTVWPYRYRRGASPLLVSMPHVGTFVPHSVGRWLSACAAQRPDTDWHLPRLYDFLEALDATVIEAGVSRYVVDFNRPADGSNLYPGRDTPRLCPVATFHGEPLYRAGAEPGAAEVAARVARYWRPYHARIARELARLREAHGVAVLWDAHSIVSEAPRLFDGRLPDFNLGTAGGASCDPALARALHVAISRHGGFTSVLDGRFTGGQITRQYGSPAQGVHAVQLEMAQRVYMDERCPWCFREDLAARVRPILREQLELALAWAVNQKGPGRVYRSGPFQGETR